MPGNGNSAHSAQADIQAALERLHEDEALTSTLDNINAKLLLDWTEEHIQAIERLQYEGVNRKALLDDLFLLCRSINCLNQSRRQMGETQFVGQILSMLDAAEALNSVIERNHGAHTSKRKNLGDDE